MISNYHRRLRELEYFSGRDDTYSALITTYTFEISLKTNI